VTDATDNGLGEEDMSNHEGARVILREVIDADLEIFFEQQLDSDAAEMAAFPARDRDAHMAHWNKIRGDEGKVVKTILYGENVAGNIGSWIQDDRREIGYWIGKPYWGKGVATAAVAQLVKLLTERPIFAHVAEHNAASIRVLEKCGFVRSIEQPDPEEVDDVLEIVMELET
jgi:RimJ/RimL family protein N-acetyltransferase